MVISWSLKKHLMQQHGIYRAIDMKNKLQEKTGVIFSMQQTCNLLNQKPISLKLSTLQLICNAFDCQLSDICQITPDAKIKKSVRKLSYKNTPHTKRGIKNFPDPQDYLP